MEFFKRAKGDRLRLSYLGSLLHRSDSQRVNGRLRVDDVVVGLCALVSVVRTTHKE